MILVLISFAIVEIPLLYVKNLVLSFNIVPRMPLLTAPLAFKNDLTFDSNNLGPYFSYISHKNLPGTIAK